MLADKERVLLFEHRPVGESWFAAPWASRCAAVVRCQQQCRWGFDEVNIDVVFVTRMLRLKTNMRRAAHEGDQLQEMVSDREKAVFLHTVAGYKTN